jgi:DNA invertase Pin-like site-specific DNA recombinase
MISGKITAIYCRVSTLDKQDSGLASQQLALESYCKAQSITDYQIYSDKMSGSKVSRPGLDAMIQDCNGGRIENVIVFSFSRFGRSLRHLIESMEYFQSKNIGFISISEKFDTTTSTGRVMFAIISALGQWEREQVSIRVKAGMANAKACGKQIGAIRKHTNPEIFTQLRKQGLTTRQIAKIIKCSPATVVRMLRQSVFLGEAS